MRFREGKRETKAVRERQKNRQRERIKKRKTEEVRDIPVPEPLAWNKIIPDFYGRCFS